MTKPSNHYVDNEKFLAALIERKKQVANCDAEGKEHPQISDYIGKCVYDICNNSSFRPRFIKYSYRQELVMDAVENCLLKINNFDPKKGENPFAYFTQIAFFAFFRRINTERKESYIKAKLVEGMLDDELYEMDNEHGELHNVIHDIRSSLYFDTADYEAQMEKKKKGKPSKLEVFMEAA